MTATYSKPKQRISSSQKNDEWYKICADYYRDSCVQAIDPAEAAKLYNLANGILDETQYLYVTNPLGTKRPDLMGYPARLMNYDIISPNINLLMGEKTRRNFPPIVYATNSNIHSIRLDEERKKLTQLLQQEFVNYTLAMGIPMEQEEIQTNLQRIQQEVKNIPDQIAIDGQNTLEYIMNYTDLPRHFRKGFYDWLVTAMVFSYKDVYKGKTYYETIAADKFYYLCSPAFDFVQDGEACRAVHRFSTGAIYDRFEDDKDFKSSGLADFLERSVDNGSVDSKNGYYYSKTDTDIRTATGELYQNIFGKNPDDYSTLDYEVEHIQWRGSIKVGKLLVEDIFGEVTEIEVSEDFKALDSDNIEWTWKDQLYEIYVIADTYYLGGRPVPIQSGEKCKLLYNGRNYFSRFTKAKSLVKKGEAYQKSVNIVKYRGEQTLAKNLDKIILFPLGLIPKKEGWDEDKLMYYVRAFSFLFFDDTRPNAAQMINALKDLDMSMLQHIVQTYQIVQQIKQEWNETCGINNQRKGETGVSAGKGVTELAVASSTVMSEELFIEFEEFEQKEYTGMLELGKYAHNEGIQAHFIKSDGSRAFLNIHDPDSFLYSDFGIFVRNGAKELQKLETLRAQVQAFAQNGASPKGISQIIEAENFAALHGIMDDIDAKMDAIRQQELQSQQEIQASQERISQTELNYKYYDSDLDSATAIQVALIKQGIGIADNMRRAEEAGDTTSDVYLAQRDKLDNNFIEIMKNATKIKELNDKVKMNKLDNQTALKNKVAGEK